MLFHLLENIAYIVVQPECFAAKEIKKRSHWFFPRCQHRTPCCVLRCRNVCHFMMSPSAIDDFAGFVIRKLAGLRFIGLIVLIEPIEFAESS